ncbi:MAG: family 1 glycosylhydrolase, partial [Candidatus Cybelea sp.]
LTMTLEREQHAFFSEPYYRTHLAVLHRSAFQLPQPAQEWRGNVAVVADTLPARIVAGWFPAATIRYLPAMPEAVEALRRGDADALFDDDVMLQEYAGDSFGLTPLPNSAQYFAVAMALGSRTLLNVVDRAIRDLRREHPEIPNAFNRKTVAHVGREDEAQTAGSGRARSEQEPVPKMDRSVERIRRRGKLRVGIHPGVSGLCTLRASAAKGQSDAGAPRYEGLEPELGRRIAQLIFGDSGRVEFVAMQGEQRLDATRSWMHALFALRKSIAIFSTLLGTNWWNLGMAGKLPEFLCPSESVGTLDFVGLDYYWGVPSFWPGELHRLSAAADFQYASAPVWPNAINMILSEAARDFPGKPIIVVENGCVVRVPGFTRADYLKAHVAQVRKAVELGAPVEAYLCWSITSNREWGLTFDDGSDFGLFHVDLDTDPGLTRKSTDSSRTYASLIADSEGS